MTADVEILRSGELMVSQISGLTEAGVDFVDCYNPPREGAGLVVVDSGRVIMQNEDVEAFTVACAARGLAVEREEGL